MKDEMKEERKECEDRKERRGKNKMMAAEGGG